MEIAGEFETHLTIRLDSSQAIAPLALWASARGLKFTHILLDLGQTVSQPMLTRYGRGVLAEELTAATRLRTELESAGFAVSRIKVEAALGNVGVPHTNADVSSHPPGRYFEHHVKLLLDSNLDRTALVELAQCHRAHLSRNALRLRSDGRHERFVTQRCYAVGRSDARRDLDALLDALESGGYEILDVEEEFVVYDSNVAIDAGWIDG
jgi:hypothetical protein